MTCDEALAKFELVPQLSQLDEIRQALLDEMKWRRQDEDDGEDHDDLLLVLCVQLFAAGQVEDSLNVWRAKQNDFDAACYIDGEFLCGAGLKKTIDYLEQQNTEESLEVLDYVLLKDWEGFTPEEHLEHYRRYFDYSN